MVLFLLAEVEQCIAQADVRKVVFERCINVRTAFDIVTVRLFQNIRFNEAIKVSRNGFILYCQSFYSLLHPLQSP